MKAFLVPLMLLMLSEFLRVLAFQSPSQLSPSNLSQGIGQTLANNIPGILTGVAAILTAALTYRKSRVENKKLESSKVGRGDLAGSIISLIKENREFRLLFRNELFEEGSIETIQKLGEFVSRSDISNFVSRSDISNFVSRPQIEDCVTKMLVTPAVLDIIKKQAELVTHTDLEEYETKLFALYTELAEKSQAEAKKFEAEVKKARRRN